MGSLEPGASPSPAGLTPLLRNILIRSWGLDGLMGQHDVGGWTGDGQARGEPPGKGKEFFQLPKISLDSVGGIHYIMGTLFDGGKANTPRIPKGDRYGLESVLRRTRLADISPHGRGGFKVGREAPAGDCSYDSRGHGAGL